MNIWKKTLNQANINHMDTTLNLIISMKNWILMLIFLAFLTPFTPYLDLKIERYFFEADHFSENIFFTFLYNYGCWPTLFFFGFSFFTYILSFQIKQIKKWQNPLLFLIISFVLGAGIIVHFALKDHWGRPRPKQVIEFGGQQNFRPYYSPNFFHQPEPSKSFPCGHCSMGFYFFSLALLGKRTGKKSVTYLGFILAFVLGITLGIARMAQGGHFFSDVLFAAYFMWIATILAEWFVYKSNYV